MSFWGKSPLREALDSVRRGKATYADALMHGIQVKGAADVAALAEVLATFEPTPKPDPKQFVGSDLHALTAVVQNAADKDTATRLRVEVLPHLIRVYDRAVAIGSEPDDLLFVLKIFAMYGDARGATRIVDGARRFPDGYLWSVIFGIIAEESHPQASSIVEGLRDDPPRGFALVAFLDLANAMSLGGRCANHPFDTPAGHEALRAWLASTEDDQESYAHSAAAALPFIAEPARTELLDVARAHRSTSVRMEATWAAAKLGDAGAIDALVGWCDDPRTAWRAMEYLRQLDADSRIPPAARTEEFEAAVEMCQWLEHPNEMARPPDSIELADSRVIHWPPTNDRRRMFVFRYRYDATPDDEAQVGYGLVGSTTFALFGENTAERTPLEVIALHCCWELEMNEDPRAPKERSVLAGLGILRKHNPDLRG